MAMYVEIEGKKHYYEGAITTKDVIQGKAEVYNSFSLKATKKDFDNESIICWDSDIEKILLSSDFIEYVMVFCGVIDENSHIYEYSTFDYLKLDEIGFFYDESSKCVIVTTEVSKLMTLSENIKKDKSDYDQIVESLVNADIDSEKLEQIRKLSKQRDDDGLLRYEIKEDDNSLVTTLKEHINSLDMYTSHVYSCFEEDGDAWNLIYGLRQRNSITWDYFMKWMAVLDCDIELTIVPNK